MISGGRERSRRSRLLVRVAWTVCGALSLAAPSLAATVRALLAPGQMAALTNLRDLSLEAEPQAGEGLLAFCRRWTGGTGSCPQIARLNRNPKRLLAGVRYRVPYSLLLPEVQLSVVRAIFPDDSPAPGEWRHRGRGESLREVAVWFTGDADNAARLRAASGRASDRLEPGGEVRIPAEILLAGFRRALPSLATAPPPPTAVAASAAEIAEESVEESVEEAGLDYGEDAAGGYAVYRLRGGEALYSSVVVRFTGRDRAEDVNALALEIAKRSGIPDVTDIPVGYPVHIPLDLLLPQYLPANDPRRLEWEVERKLAEQYRQPAAAKGLAGVTVILDAGHGGADVGASRAGVWESVYVYDVTERIRRELERRTLARVETTTRDGDRGGPIQQDVLPYSRRHAVLTTPAYPITDATVGVHLRWYLANSVFRRHAATSGDDRVIFVSVHADSLHPSLRGATVYIPNIAGTAGTYGKQGAAFSSRREVREQPTVSYSLRERQKSEGRSRTLAERLIAGFRANDLAVHPFQPVRDRIFRGRRAWVPAVLRYNAVPAKVLLEVCNLANDADRKLLQTLAFRDAIAEAVVDGILAYFGEGD
jgi:N-acetylmuramoyl-L-alanine amidase